MDLWATGPNTLRWYTHTMPLYSTYITRACTSIHHVKVCHSRSLTCTNSGSILVQHRNPGPAGPHPGPTWPRYELHSSPCGSKLGNEVGYIIQRCAQWLGTRDAIREYARRHPAATHVCRNVQAYSTTTSTPNICCNSSGIVQQRTPLYSSLRA